MKSLTVPSSNDVVVLSERAKRYIRKSKAENTIDTYRRAWADFQWYCCERDVAALPASPQTIVDFLTMLADAGAKVSTIQVKLAALAYFHRTGGHADPTTHEAVVALMEGIRREKHTAPKRVKPMVRKKLRAMLPPLQDGNLTHLRDRALLLIAFAGAFRSSELVGLNFQDLFWNDEYMTITLRRSKTDQTGAGITKKIPRICGEHSALCPVNALLSWLWKAEINAGPLFRKVDRWGNVSPRRMNRRAVEFIIKRAAAAAGLDPALYAGHSARAGFVTQAVADGVPEYQIQEVTGHKDPGMVRRYIRDEGAGQVNAVRTVMENDE